LWISQQVDNDPGVDDQAKQGNLFGFATEIEPLGSVDVFGVVRGSPNRKHEEL
jgi:hypothetical protein